MKDMKKFLLMNMLIFLGFVVGCNEQSQKQESKKVDTSSKSNLQKSPAIDTAGIVRSIEEKRIAAEISIKDLKPTEISTSGMREKIKQKWSKIHFYEKDGKVIRVKSYPYEKISERTEEFYFDNGALIAAVIEDKGSAPADKEYDNLDKIYYFYNNELISERNKTEEKEYSIKHSDGEELLQEAMEYLEIYKNKK